MRISCCLAVLAPVWAAACPVPAAAAAATYIDRVFDASKLHRVVVSIPDYNARNFISRDAGRQHCTVTFDGETVRDVGVRQSGTFLPYVGIGQKPSLSIKFNEFIKGQGLFGLKKLTLKNMAQDRSLVTEHLADEIYRRAGIAAPLTAYAQVTINGADQGIYLVREAVNQQFLARNFGKDNDGGNLYEVAYPVDLIANPNRVNLKDEIAETRSRDDLRRLATAVLSSTPGTFVKTVGPSLDIDRFITVYAVEALVDQWDGYAFNYNNNYVYDNPKDGRFIFIPYGADQALGTLPRRSVKDTMQEPVGRLAQAIRSVPELTEKYRAEVERVSQEPVWDKTVLLARVAQVAKVLATADTQGRASGDIARFHAGRAGIETFIRNGGTPHPKRSTPAK